MIKGYVAKISYKMNDNNNNNVSDDERNIESNGELSVRCVQRIVSNKD